MVLIKEYRIPLPFTMEEYRKGLLFAIARASESENVSGIPMKVLANEEFKNQQGFEKGIYTHRIISITNRLPEWGKKLLIRSGAMLHVEERSWNAFPKIKTIYTCPVFSQEKCEVIVESHHAEDAGTTDNIHGLSKAKLSQRIVDHIDIVSDPVDTNRYYRKEEDPTLFKSKKTGRGPLKRGWQKNTKPIMCAYKLVTVNFSYWGVRSKVEKLIQDVIRNVYLCTHRQAFCWIDDWYNLSFEEIRSIEGQTTKKINSHTGELDTDEESEDTEKTSEKKEGKIGGWLRSKL